LGKKRAKRLARVALIKKIHGCVSVSSVGKKRQRESYLAPMLNANKKRKRKKDVAGGGLEKMEKKKKKGTSILLAKPKGEKKTHREKKLLKRGLKEKAEGSLSRAMIPGCGGGGVGGRVPHGKKPGGQSCEAWGLLWSRRGAGQRGKRGNSSKKGWTLKPAGQGAPRYQSQEG